MKKNIALAIISLFLAQGVAQAETLSDSQINSANAALYGFADSESITKVSDTEKLSESEYLVRVMQSIRQECTDCGAEEIAQRVMKLRMQEIHDLHELSK